ncbi:DUF2637 domain-containing protein [Micromonospora sp. LZ34]
MSAPTQTTMSGGDGPTGWPPSEDVAQLRRLRWAVRATLTLGVAASVAANVLHARPGPISQIIAAWPPLALLLTVELISRVPHHRRSLGLIRIAATGVIAAIATWVSYWHLVGVAVRYGETEAGAAYLLPISVDGLVIVASVSLVDITARIRAWEAKPRPHTAAGTIAAAVTAPPAAHQRAAAPDSSTDAGRSAMPHRPAEAAANGIDESPQASVGTSDEHVSPNGRPQGSPTPPRAAQRMPDTVGVAHQTRDVDARSSPTGGHHDLAKSPDVPPKRSNRGDDQRGGELLTSDTAAAVAYWHRRDPDLHPAEIAARIGRSERTVRRYWPPPAPTAPPINTDNASGRSHLKRA